MTALVLRPSRGSWRGFVVGALAASLVLNAGETLLHGVIFATAWADAVARLGRTLDTSLGAWGLIIAGNSVHGVALIGLGALLMPRLGSPIRCAVLAAAGVWAVGWLAPVLGALSFRLFPLRLWGLMLGAGLVELLLAAAIGLWLYSRSAAK